MKKYQANKYLGKYQKFLLVLYGRATFNLACPKLERFFGCFVPNVDLRRITVTDISDYLTAFASEVPLVSKEVNTSIGPSGQRSRGVRERKVKSIHLNALNAFWQWCIIDQGLPLTNPVKPYLTPTFQAAPPVRKNKYPRLQDFKAVLAQATPQLREHLLKIVAKEPVGKGSHPRWVTNAMRETAERAGVPCFTMKQLRSATAHGLWKEMIKDYANTIGDELAARQQATAIVKDAERTQKLWGTRSEPHDLWVTAPFSEYQDPQAEWIT